MYLNKLINFVRLIYKQISLIKFLNYLNKKITKRQVHKMPQLTI